MHRAQVDAPIALGVVVCHEVEHVPVRHDQNALLGLALAVDLYTQSTPWASAVRHTLAVQMPFASAAASHAKCRALAVRTSSCVTRVHMPCAFRRAHAVCRAHVMPCTRLGHGAGPHDGVVCSRVGQERLEHLGVALELEVVRHATVRLRGPLLFTGCEQNGGVLIPQNAKKNRNARRVGTLPRDVARSARPRALPSKNYRYLLVSQTSSQMRPRRALAALAVVLLPLVRAVCPDTVDPSNPDCSSCQNQAAAESKYCAFY